MTNRDPLWKNVMKPVVTVTGGGTSQTITKTSYRLHEIATNKRVGRIHAAWRHNRWSEDPDAIETIQIHPIGVSHVQLPADLKNCQLLSLPKKKKKLRSKRRANPPNQINYTPENLQGYWNWGFGTHLYFQARAKQFEVSIRHHPPRLKEKVRSQLHM